MQIAGGLTGDMADLLTGGIAGGAMAGRMGDGIECCDSVEVHEELVRSVEERMPREEELYELAELFKVFGDSTRIRILYVLFEEEVCVCDLAEALGMTQPAISHQLKILKQARLISSRREGKSVFYSLADGHVRTIIAQGWEHLSEEVPLPAGIPLSRHADEVGGRR